MILAGLSTLILEMLPQRLNGSLQYNPRLTSDPSYNASDLLKLRLESASLQIRLSSSIAHSLDWRKRGNQDSQRHSDRDHWMHPDLKRFTATTKRLTTKGSQRERKGYHKSPILSTR